MGSFWLWGWWFFLTLPDRLSCPLFIYMVHFEFESTGDVLKDGDGVDFLRFVSQSRKNSDGGRPGVALACRASMSRRIL